MTPTALKPMIRYDMKPVERALCQAAYERSPHPSRGPAECYLLRPALRSGGLLLRHMAFARREPGSGGIVDWHFHPGDGTRVLLRSPEQLQSLLKNLAPSLPIADSGKESPSPGSRRD